MTTAPKAFTFETSVTVRSAAPPEVVFDVVSDLRAHLVWGGERATDETFKLLDLQTSDETARVGTTFSSTGANFNGTFHDRSTVSEVSRPSRFRIETDSHLDRKHGRDWDGHWIHRYDIEADGDGSRIVYTDTLERVNYVPYWLQWWLRPLTRREIHKADTKQLGNLARLAEERAAG